MSTRGFLIEILLHRNLAVDRSNLLLFIYFYYSQIISTFTRSFYCFIIHVQTINDYDVPTLKIIHPITFQIMQSNQSKCCEIKITCKNMQPFYTTVPRTPSEYFCTNVFYNIKLPQIQDKYFISRF